MMSTETPLHLASTHLRLKPDARVERLPVGPDFWPDLMAGKLGDFHHEYLVTHVRFDRDWDSAEVHPHGDEIVVLLSGAADLLLLGPDGDTRVPLRKPGDFAIVPKATWHTADILSPGDLLFITAGEGTQGRPRY